MRLLHLVPLVLVVNSRLPGAGFCGIIAQRELVSALDPRSGCQWGHSDALVALKTQVAHLAQNNASRPEHPWTHLLNVFACYLEAASA